jgi:NAD(P)-dependent dehydrogenase (short-subunit alcohol dehydrogenase family)
MMLLNDKVAVIYGAGGGIGGAVARAFALEGAEVHLTGRRLGPVNVVARKSPPPADPPRRPRSTRSDERAVDAHLQSVIDRAAASTSRSMRSASPTRTSWVSL